MDIQLEKASIIKRFENITDELLIKEVKKLLDESCSNEEYDKQLEDSINKALVQSEKGEGKAHKLVMSEMRAKYSNGL